MNLKQQRAAVVCSLALALASLAPLGALAASSGEVSGMEAAPALDTFDARPPVVDPPVVDPPVSDLKQVSKTTWEIFGFTLTKIVCGSGGKDCTI